MYCPSCGAAEQAGAFCCHCGQRIGAASPAQQTLPPAIKNDVNVSVNIGGPTVIQAGRAPGPGATVVQGAMNVFQAARQAKREALERQTALQQLQANTIALLDTSHEIIAEIEGGIGLELLPVGSTTRARYARGLDMRREAAELLSRTVTEAELRRAYDLVVYALQDLRTTKEEVHLSLP